MNNYMWTLQYKPNKDSQPWSTLDSYDNRLSAIVRASWVSREYFMVKVIDPDGTVIWSN
jgi:hypothetical protein